MSYHIYQTEGIILGKKDVGEADSVFDILTENFGRIEASAQGVRHLKSKLRYSLKKINYMRVGLVAGSRAPDLWRIIDAEELNGFFSIHKDTRKLSTAVRVMELVDRMVKGSHPDACFWKEVKNILRFLDKKELKPADFGVFELLAKIRLLCHLGYIAESEKWMNVKLTAAKNMENLMSSTAEEALEASQL